MDVRQLRYFVTLAETLHFGRAAQRLGMTQPPLSQAILALEAELGAPLFTRTKRSVTLTRFGAQWLDHARAGLDAVQALPEIARRLREGEVGRLELSFVSTADYNILPELVRRYGALYPQVEISLSEATSDLQVAALLEGRGQAGIIIPPVHDTLPTGLAYRRLLSERLIAAVPQAWLRAGGRLAGAQGALPAEALADTPLIVFPRPLAPDFYDKVIAYHRRHGGQARIAQEAIQMQTIVSLVSAGMGIALVPASLRNLARAGVCYLDLPDDAPVLETGIIWRRDDQAPTLTRLLQLAEAISAKALPRKRSAKAPGD